MKYIFSPFVMLALILSVSSCKNTYKLDVKQQLLMDQYETYAFRLCERINTVGKDRFLLCDNGCDENDVQANDKIQVVEELYILRSKLNPEDLVYITTRSDKYIHEDKGAFNANEYKDHIFTKDLERFYFGKLNASQELVFTNLKDTLLFTMAPANATECSLQIEKITSVSDEKVSISNRPVVLKTVFSVPVKLVKTDRKLVNRKNRRDSIFDAVQSIDLRGRRIFFTGENSEESLSQRRWLKYHPEFKIAD